MLLASVNPRIEALLLPVLIQLVVIIVAARLAAVVFRRFKQPFVVGEIAAGLLLGPSCFGRFFPELSATIFNPEVKPVFGVMSQIGLILLLFLIGLEFDFAHLRKLGRAAVAISLTGIVLPMALGVGLAFCTHEFVRQEELEKNIELLGYALFMGTAMSITAIPILGRMMMELGVTRTKVGAVTITSAAVDDACGWIILATISSIVQAKYHFGGTLKMLA